MKKVGKAGRNLRYLDAVVFVAGVVSLLVVWPFRGLVESVPVLGFLAALVLFATPGVLVAGWFMGDHFPGISVLPLGFVISAGFFGLLGAPMLLTNRSLDLYTGLAGAVIAGFLVVTAIRVFLHRPAQTDGEEPDEEGERDWYAYGLWVPFVLFGGMLIHASRLSFPAHHDDIWIYLSFVRDFTSMDRLAESEPYFGEAIEASRVQINGWLLEQAALSRVSGIDTVEFVLEYLQPTLIVVSLLAVYSLARILLEDGRFALLCGCLYALFLLTHIGSLVPSFGQEFISRVVEDKFLTRYVFLPVALGVAVAYLRSRRVVYFGMFALICCSVMTIHPIGLAIVGLCMAGFGLLHLAANLTDWRAWARVGGMGAAGVGVVAIPGVLLYLVSGRLLTDFLKDADINSGNPEVLANMVFVKERRNRIVEFADGSYAMHPLMLSDAVILLALVIAIPFLIWRIRGSLAAQLLLGGLAVVMAVCYVPQLATFVGENIVLPGQLWRLAWPIPLLAVLVCCWALWDFAKLLSAGAVRIGAMFLTPGLLALLSVLSLLIYTTPHIAGGLQKARESEDRRLASYCLDPALPWLRDNIESPSLIFAPDAVNTCIPSYSANADVTSSRGILVLDVLPELRERTEEEIGIPRGLRDQYIFFNPAFKNDVREEILRRYDADYIMFYEAPGLNERIADIPGITPVEIPGDRYVLYRFSATDAPE